MKAVKLLISGQESSGKSTLTSQIDDSMVIVVDGKSYPFNKPHYRIDEYNGIADFKNILITKIKAYKAKYDELPKVIVIDTITKMYENMYIWSQENFKGFDIFNAINKDTLYLNKVIESTLIKKGIDVVIVAHATYDESTGRYVIPAKGEFKNTGSWMSVVDEASFLYTLGQERYIAHTELKYPCRSTLDLVGSEPVDKYSINDHLNKLREKATETESNVL